jgi:hypothetical protein
VPTSVCSQAVFKVNGVTTYVTWSLSSNLKGFYGGTDYVAVAPNGSGPAFVNASVTPTGCPTVVLPTLNVYVGSPSKPVIIFTRDGSNCDYYAYTQKHDGLTYYWSEDGTNWVIGDNKYGFFDPPITATVYLKVASACGMSPIATKIQQLNVASGCKRR